MNDPITWGAVISVGAILIGVLCRLLWRAYRHEIAGLKGTDANLLRLLDRLSDEIKLREQDDRGRWEAASADAHSHHEEVLVTLGELSAAIAELRGKVA